MDQIDNQHYQQINDYLENEFEKILFLENYFVIINSQKEQKFLCLATNYKFCLFSLKFLHKKPDLNLSFTWDKLLSLNQINKEIIQLEFNDFSIQIKVNNINFIYLTLSSYINLIFNKFELPKMFTYNKLRRPTFSYDSPQISRFIFSCFKNKLNIEKDTIKSLNDHIEFNKNQLKKSLYYTFDFSQINNFEYYLIPLIDSLLVSPIMKSITLPKSKLYNSWSIYSLIIDNPNIYSIQIQENINLNFVEFIQKLSLSSKTKIVSLYLCENNIEVEVVELIYQLINSYSFKSINISKFFTPLTYYYFENCFLTYEKIFPNTKFLSVNNSKGIDISKILKFFPNVQRIDIENNDIDISLFFEEISLQKLNKIRDIKCKGNFCTGFSSTNLLLPLNLQRIEANNINWINNSLISIFKIICFNSDKLKKKIILDFSKSNLELQYWMIFYEEIESLHSNVIQTLKFSFNPLMKNFFEFLKKLFNLESIFLNGCFNDNDENLIYLLEFLKNNYYLKKLSICGSDINKISNFIKIYEVLKDKKLYYIDIQNNNIGDEIIEYILNFYKSMSTLKFISFDKNNITDFSKFINLIEYLEKNNIKSNLKIPKNDLIKIINNNKQLNIDLNGLINRIKKNYPTKIQNNKKSKLNKKNEENTQIISDDDIELFSSTDDENDEMNFKTNKNENFEFEIFNENLNLFIDFPLNDELIEKINENDYLNDENWIESFENFQFNLRKFDLNDFSFKILEQKIH